MALVLFCLCWQLAAPAMAAEIRITNFADDTTIRYPVALLRGQAAVPDGSQVLMVNETSTKASREFGSVVLSGRFKVLAELVPGLNRLVLRCADGEMQLSLRYQPMTTPHFVRLIYVTDPGGRTEYPTLKENDPQDYKAKLSVAATLLQTFNAEAMNDLGLGRRTFHLERDEEHNVVVHTMPAPQSASHYHALNEGTLFGEMAALSRSRFPTDRAVNLIIMGFARYDAVQRRFLGHTARGGGNIAVFSNLGMFSWPSTLQEVQAAFVDTRRVDDTRVHGDSRGVVWGVAATTIGVLLHELGHAFGLPHSPEHLAIMEGRGFDQFNRAFTVIEPPTAHTQNEIRFDETDRSHFDYASAARLVYHRFFEMDARTYSDQPAPMMSIDPGDGQLTVIAPAGLRMAGIDRAGLSRASEIYPAKPHWMRFTDKALSKAAGGSNLSMVLMDDNGNQSGWDSASFHDVRPFIRSWHLIEEPAAWLSAQQFREVSTAQLQQLTIELKKRPLATKSSHFIDLAEHYIPTVGNVENKVAYALRTLRSEREQRVDLLTGSDDALRVWLNGRLVLDKLLLRAAAPDTDRTPLTLRRGDNELLVEVSTTSGGWGFYGRIVDAQRQNLAVAGDGSVISLHEFYAPATFARQWHLSERVTEWSSPQNSPPTTFVAASLERRRQLSDEMKARPLESSDSPYIDLLAFYSGKVATQNKVAYAFRSFQNAKSRPAVLLTGSDDALRVWLNGELVVDKLALRAAHADTDRTPVKLKAGENQLLVEVSNFGGGWGFFLRLRDPNGAALVIQPNGELAP